MDKKQTVAIRPTKKQTELLTFIEAFIGQHGYSPSYREVMNGLNYTSVATVALHINNLIKRGHLRKRDHSARSLEVVKGGITQLQSAETVGPDNTQWLTERVEAMFAPYELSAEAEPRYTVAQIQTVISAIELLGLEAVARNFDDRLALITLRQAEPNEA